MFETASDVVRKCVRTDERSLRYRYIAAAATPSRVEYGSAKYFMLCSLAGISSCGLTHAIVVPLDLIKTRLQVDPDKYKNLVHGFKVSVREEGVRGLAKGIVPTMIGYATEGAVKFGFYEFFKKNYFSMVDKSTAYEWRTLIYLCSSASAEFFADMFLIPWESTRVKIQSVKGFPSKLVPAMTKMYKEEGLHAFFKSLVPLWGRQIPYTMMKFASFERTLESLYKHVVKKPKDDCSKGFQLIITFAAGYIAGILCAIVSHPADTILSRINQEKGLKMMDVAKKIGFRNLYKGLFTRVLMIGTLTGIQWFIYDFVKVALGIPRPPPPQDPSKK